LSTKMSISRKVTLEGPGPSKSDRVASIEALLEKEKEIMTMTPQQEDIIKKPKPKVRFRVF